MLFYAAPKILVKKAQREPGKTEFQERFQKAQTHLAFTDLGSPIGNTQCGKFRIFLQLRVYVKSI